MLRLSTAGEIDIDEIGGYATILKTPKLPRKLNAETLNSEKTIYPPPKIELTVPPPMTKVKPKFESKIPVAVGRLPEALVKRSSSSSLIPDGSRRGSHRSVTSFVKESPPSTPQRRYSQVCANLKGTCKITE